MSTTDTRLQQARNRARRRAMLTAALFALPWLLVAIALAWRADAAPWSQWMVAATSVAAAWHIWRSGCGFDDRWQARALDAQRPDMDDSADLLFTHAAQDNPLQTLQRDRLRQRIRDRPTPELQTPWPTRRLLICAAVACGCIAAIVLYPALSRITPLPASAPVERPMVAQPPQLLDQHIDIQPPAYTDMPTRTVDTLAARAPEGSTLRWTLHFAPAPERVELVFHDGRRLALERDEDEWVGSLQIDKPSLYRIELEQPLPPAQAGPHRLDLINDTPPQLRALKPRKTLTLIEAGQRAWTLEFEASDDYGLATNARLHLTQTEGGGENITAKHHAITLRGRGDARNKRYRYQVDLAALGLAEGNDIIAKLSVSDRRAPKPQTTESPSYILRWPADAVILTDDLDGVVKRVMPAYFRSQRQIIIDAEALLEEKPRLDADTYLEKSDTIGVDQRLLRLRYGQFLGEETGGEPQLAVTADAQDEYLATLNDDATDTDATPTAHDDHGHSDGMQRQATFGEAQDMVEQFGHTHDHAEAATLLDPASR